MLVLPVGVILFLHFFGENRMKVPVLHSLADCEIRRETYFFLTGLVATNHQKNQLARINKRIASKQMVLDTAQGGCLSDTLALLMIDKRSDLRGSYALEHADINRFFMEMDILLMVENYGEEVSR